MGTPYDDMLRLPHPSSARHARMPMRSRAAQFAPFAALSGYEQAVKETARRTDRRAELDEDAKAALDERLRMVQAHAGEVHVWTFTYFVPDPKKPGGAYVTVSGAVKRVDLCKRIVVLQSGAGIPIDEIVEIDGRLLQACGD